MTIVVTIKVTDGMVLAADSAASFFDGAGAHIKTYNNANKIFNLRKVWPLGALVYGAGGIGSASIETLSKGLRKKFSDPLDDQYYLNPTAYTVEEVANKAKQFLFAAYQQAYPNPVASYFLGYRVCGYSYGALQAESWEFTIHGENCNGPTVLQPLDGGMGVRWAGLNEALDRLLLGISNSREAREIFKARDLSDENIDGLFLEFAQKCGKIFTIPAMPIQDAIDVARFLVDTASRFARYGIGPETIGGPTEIAAITKHEGFKWISRKHYYSPDLNRETDHA